MTNSNTMLVLSSYVLMIVTEKAGVETLHSYIRIRVVLHNLLNVLEEEPQRFRMQWVHGHFVSNELN